MIRLHSLFPVCAAVLAGCSPSEATVLSGNAGGAAGAAGAVGSSGSGGATAGGGGTAGAGGSGGGVARSCKRGIAYGHHSVADLTAVSTSVAWWYNWSPGPDDPSVAAAYAGLGVEFVPMIWGPGDLKPARVAMIPADAKVLLGFNEPNFKSQSNLSPADAAALWPQVQQIAKDRGLKLVSPGLNYCGPAANCWTTDPFDWFDQFFAACPTCTVDYIGVHWYACTKNALVDYLTKVKSKYGKPVWLTEFSCLDDATKKSDPALQSSYMADALALLEADPMIARYSWFTGRYDMEPAINLLGASGALTPLGSQYLQTKGNCP